MLNIDKLKQLREAAGLSQERAARSAGIGTRQHWNKLETGRSPNINLETLRKIAAALEVDPRELLTPPAPRRQKGKKP